MNKQTIGKGFTLIEVIIAIALLGVIAALVLPKFMGNQFNTANANRIKQTFTTVGELCLRRQSESTLPAINWAQTSPTSIAFCNYLGANLKGQCTNTCLCKFSTGVEITGVSTETIGAINSLVITFRAPSIPSYQMVIQPNPSHPDGYATRYTTRYAVTGLASDKINEVEMALNSN